MKYGLYLQQNIDPEFGVDSYLDYDKLKLLIKQIGKSSASVDTTNPQQLSSYSVSMSVPPPTDQKKAMTPTRKAKSGSFSSNNVVTDEDFFAAIDSDMSKIETFTSNMVRSIRDGLSLASSSLAEAAAAGAGDSPSTSNGRIRSKSNSKLTKKQVQHSVDAIGTTFLKLEKFVNLNFMGFHKILKKHDKFLPNKCKQFYVARMHSQSWVKGDYSDIVVRLSGIYASIRGDSKVAETNNASQAFMRSTTKYWVNTADISKVKYAILQNLPVFLQKTSTGETDSQLTNSVYLDNSSLELYHGRLDKSPGAIAVRLRWYGNGDPSIVFVERKTHRDSWTGEVSVKERFIVSEVEIKSIMDGSYDLVKAKQKMKEKGAGDEEIADWEILVMEILTAINSKQLVPTMRTQYMRTAFQIPFDATVRVSLDTNLCMISERGYDIEGGARWHRDPSIDISESEIARFPHAVLEIKLEVKEGSSVPPWVEELQSSGLLYEVHKFSKFIHGCSTLLADDVQTVPYWVDDASLRSSIIASGAGRILADGGEGLAPADPNARAGAGPGANQIYSHLLPHGTKEEAERGARGARTSHKVDFGATGEIRYNNYGLNYVNEYGIDSDDEDDGGGCCWPSVCCSGWNEETAAPTSIQKVEPKIFFANERTFIHWLHMGVILNSVASGVLAFSKSDHSAQIYAIMLLPLSLGFCVYALHTFLWRAERIRMRVPGRWDDPTGPMILSLSLVAVLLTNFFMKIKIKT